MRSTFKVLFYVNGSKEKNGIVPIMGRVTINGSVAQFSCKQTIAKDLWDAKGNCPLQKSVWFSPNAFRVEDGARAHDLRNHNPTL